MSSSRGAEVISLGCRLNIAEGARLRELLGTRDLVVVNSCAVTAAAVKQTRAALRRARRDRPDAIIAVTGCAAQIAPGDFAAMAEVDRVVGNADKLVPASWDDPLPVRVSDWARVAELAPHLAVGSDGARAFVEVQNGCDHRCTFCTIPAGRGPSRSAPIAAVVEEVAALVAAGKREVVLTGVDLTSHEPGLGALVERILGDVAGLERLRLSSLDAPEIDDRLFALITQEPRVMPHLHLSLQAGDDLILKRMKRRHTRADAVRLVERLKAARPEIAIGADLIAGFPTEDEAAARNTLALIADCAIVHTHIFPYSPRPGTPAARMPQVTPEIRRARAARLREAAAERRAGWLAGLVGTRQAVLIEAPGDRGHAEGFAEVILDSRPSIDAARHPGLELKENEKAGLPVKPGVTKEDGPARDRDAIGSVLPVRIAASDGTRLRGIPL